LLRAGRTCLQAVPADARADVAFTLDGVLDDEERLWLLEVNCNPQLHPAFYQPMLDALFERVHEEV
jgi:D-alanine-D-alanine ligase-like ATP-grasp enzyme